MFLTLSKTALKRGKTPVIQDAVFSPTDDELTAAAIACLDVSPVVNNGSVEVTVANGWLTLTGEQEWWYQKNDAAYAVHDLPGVVGIINLITIRPTLASAELETAIRSAFHENALLDGYHLRVEVHGNHVILSGDVRSLPERDIAELTAGSVSGVHTVENRVAVKCPWDGEAGPESR